MAKPKRPGKASLPVLVDASAGPSVVFRSSEAEVTTGFVDIPSSLSANESVPGSRVYFEDTGGDGRVLVFVYGLGCSIFHWKHQLPYLLRTGHRIIWFDYRGHGRSPALPPGTRLRLSTLEHDIAAVCLALGVKVFTLMGQSMGGSLALKFAHSYPQMVAGLVLLAAPPKPPSQTFKIGRIGTAAWRAAIALNKTSPAVVRQGMSGIRRLMKPMAEVIRVLGFNPYLANTADIEEYVEELLAVDPNLFWDLAADLEDLDLEKLTPDIACPTLVIAGARDQVVPLDHAVWLTKRLPAAEIEIVKHGSHCPHFDDPPLVNRRIEKFLKTHGL